MPEHLDTRTTISRDMFYCVLASKPLLQNKKIKIKTSLLTIKFLKKDANQFFFTWPNMALQCFMLCWSNNTFKPAVFKKNGAA